MKLAVPTCTAVAPARMNSSASVAFMMPPMPMIGTLTARATSQTMRSATGLIAGPERPPVMLASTGRRFLRSIAMPIRVLISDSASAPASTQACAMATMSVTLGESLTISGFLVTARQALTTLAAHAGSVPKTIPPCLTLGHEMFISSAAISGISSRRRAISAYSSMVPPKKLAIAGVSTERRKGTLLAMKASMPTFCRPMALSIPPGVSTIRGVGLPARGLRHSPLVTKAPIVRKSTCSANSWP